MKSNQIINPKGVREMYFFRRKEANSLFANFKFDDKPHMSLIDQETMK